MILLVESIKELRFLYYGVTVPQGPRRRYLASTSKMAERKEMVRGGASMSSGWMAKSDGSGETVGHERRVPRFY